VDKRPCNAVLTPDFDQCGDHTAAIDGTLYVESGGALMEEEGKRPGNHRLVMERAVC
jgi:hypothetical protein